MRYLMIRVDRAKKDMTTEQLLLKNNLFMLEHVRTKS